MTYTAVVVTLKNIVLSLKPVIWWLLFYLIDGLQLSIILLPNITSSIINISIIG